MKSINEIKKSIPDFYSEQEKNEIVRLLIELAEVYLDSGTFNQIS